MNWMIYPAARAFIKVCAVLFGAGAAAAVLIHLFMPFFLRSPRTAAPFLLLGTGAELLSILSLSFLMFWGARVLLASRGSRITRNLSMLAFLPALYALLIPFAGMPVPSQYTEMDRVWEAVLLLAAVTSFFSFPYTAAGRRLFLAWGIAAAGCGLQSALFFLAVLLRQFLSTAVPSLAAPVAWLAVLLSCGLEIMLAALSVLLAQRLFKEVMSIASMPEPIDPSMPGNRP